MGASGKCFFIEKIVRKDFMIKIGKCFKKKLSAGQKDFVIKIGGLGGSKK